MSTAADTITTAPAMPPLNGPRQHALYDPHGNYRRGRAVIASIFPERLMRRMPTLSPMETYVIEPCEKRGDPPTRLAVYDAAQRMISPASVGNDYPEFVELPIFAEGIAKDLIYGWTGNTIGADKTDASIGVRIIEGEIPTQQETDEMMASQETFFRWLIRDADTMWAKHEFKAVQNTDIYRVALKWLGSEDREWARQIKAVTMKDCSACGQTIQGVATVCNKCSTDLVKLFLERGYEPEDEVVVREMRRAQAARASSKTIRSEVAASTDLLS